MELVIVNPVLYDTSLLVFKGYGRLPAGTYASLYYAMHPKMVLSNYIVIGVVSL